MKIVRSFEVAEADVRAFVATVVPEAVLENEFDPWTAQAAEISVLTQKLEEAERSTERRVREARSAGYAQGAAAAEQDFNAQSAAIAAAARSASDSFAAHLGRSDQLAVMIAHAALTKVFEDPEGQADRVISAVRRQLTQLRRETVVAIHVSASDFPTEGSRTDAARAVGEAKLVLDADLPSGGCLIKLKLGELDLGLQGQWRALSQILLGASEGAEP